MTHTDVGWPAANASSPGRSRLEKARPRATSGESSHSLPCDRRSTRGWARTPTSAATAYAAARVSASNPTLDTPASSTSAERRARYTTVATAAATHPALRPTTSPAANTGTNSRVATTSTRSTPATTNPAATIATTAATASTTSARAPYSRRRPVRAFAGIPISASLRAV